MSPTMFNFMISYPEELCSETLDGRVLLMISNDEGDEPRFQISNYPDNQRIFGLDVEDMKPGHEAVIDSDVFGFPLESINQVPPGEYWVQALIHRYETFHRSDGRVVKLPMDQGEGQKWNLSPGNLYSTPKRVRIDVSKGGSVEIVLDQIIPPVEEPEDTSYIKHVKIQSKLLTEFWGRPMHLGAVLLLPEGFEEHPEARYPLIVWHGHFNQNLYTGFSETPPDPEIEAEPIKTDRLKKTLKDPTGPDVPRDPEYYEAHNILTQKYAYKLYKDWKKPGFPRMVLMCIQHPTPYYDDSYAVNSANQGPYGDAINQELIPYVEEKFRCIGEGWARTLMGGSTGGWEVLATQVFYPDDYNGCWCWCPDPVDFRAMCLTDIYEDTNAYYIEGNWKRSLRAGFRTTVGEVLFSTKEEAQLELVKGTRCRAGGQWDIWFATYGPVAEDGYPAPLFDRMTGEIDPSVVEYWKENYDLRHIMERDWKVLGPKLKGKLRFYCGDMDSHYLNNAVYLMEEFLENTEDPYYDGLFMYGDRYSHCWYGDPNVASALDRFVIVQRLAKEMAEHITKTAPPGADVTSWKY